MIDATELRIGNLILFEDGSIIEVRGIHPSGKNIHDGKKWIEVFRLNPIPLTEEWLLKFGFKPFCNDWSKKALIIHTRKRGFVIKRSIPIIKSVHQLQNLYFALTGTELTIK